MFYTLRSVSIFGVIILPSLLAPDLTAGLGGFFVKLFVSVCLPAYLCGCVSLSLFVCLCQFDLVFVCPSVCLPVCLPVKFLSQKCLVNSLDINFSESVRDEGLSIKIF